MEGSSDFAAERPSPDVRTLSAETSDEIAGSQLDVQTRPPHDLHGMRTTLNIDDEALAEAMRRAPGKTKTDVINTALREFARRERRKGLLALRGHVAWRGSVARLRKRTP